MKYLDIVKKQPVPNKEVDKFLMELHFLCKRHKMCIGTANPKYPLIIESYDKTSVKKMLGNVQLNLKQKKKESEEDEKLAN
jgi:hypothetical protein